jgi:hypothetical protein
LTERSQRSRQRRLSGRRLAEAALQVFVIFRTPCLSGNLARLLANRTGVHVDFKADRQLNDLRVLPAHLMFSFPRLGQVISVDDKHSATLVRVPHHSSSHRDRAATAVGEKGPPEILDISRIKSTF